MKKIIKIVIVLLVIIGVFNTFFIPNDYASCDLKKLTTCVANNCDAEQFKNCDKVDAIVVVSGGDTKARTFHGVKLYQAGLSDKIIMSGAAYHDNVPSNAEEMAQIAIDAGVPAGDVIIEKKSRNTHQNAAFVKETLAKQSAKKIALVTSAYHQRRAHIEFKKALGGMTIIYDAPIMNDNQWSHYTWWVNPYNWFLAIKEIGGLVLAGTGNSI